jgi:hypothetical protein
MSYEDNGIEFEGDGLGAILQTNTVSSGVRSLQQDLQRLGRLAAGTGSDGADGRWGPLTAAALLAAARAAGWSGAPFTQRTSTTVEVADELIARIHTAATTSTAPGPTTTTSTDLVPSPTTTTADMPIIPSGPGILPGMPGADTTTPPSTTNWPLIIGGSVATVALIGVIAMSLGSPGMAKNRRVRRNRVRRNKTKRTRRYRAR